MRCARRLLHSVPISVFDNTSDATRPQSSLGLSTTAITRPGTLEIIMEYFSPNGLLRMQRHELLALYQHVLSQLTDLTEGSRGRAVALINLASICWAL